MKNRTEAAAERADAVSAKSAGQTRHGNEVAAHEAYSDAVKEQQARGGSVSDIMATHAALKLPPSQRPSAVNEAEAEIEELRARLAEAEGRLTISAQITVKWQALCDRYAAFSNNFNDAATLFNRVIVDDETAAVEFIKGRIIGRDRVLELAESFADVARSDVAKRFKKLVYESLEADRIACEKEIRAFAKVHGLENSLPDVLPAAINLPAPSAGRVRGA